jgi:hypothetical protein
MPLGRRLEADGAWHRLTVFQGSIVVN